MPTVLIVDDHEQFRTSARRMLEQAGFDVVGEAADGTTALAQVALLHPDTVLLDVQLPDMSGFEVARQICGTSVHPKVVLTSTRDLRDYGPALRRSGAVGFIAKHELSGPMLAAAAGIG